MATSFIKQEETFLGRTLLETVLSISLSSSRAHTPAYFSVVTPLTPQPKGEIIKQMAELLRATLIYQRSV